MTKRQMDIKEFRATITDIVRFVDEFCEKHGLRCYLGYGTMLGAVRHKGFIPWDDDADMVMPRPDYEALKKAFNEEDTGKYKIVDVDREGYTYPFIKVEDASTLLLDDNATAKDVGVSVDIFPMDGLGNSEETAKKMVKKAYFYREILYLNGRKRFTKHNSFLKSAAKLAFFIFSKAVGTKWARKKLDKLCLTYAFDKCAFVGNIAYGDKEKEIMPVEIFTAKGKYAFEDGEFSGVADYDGYLTRLYGDYMTPPPEGQRENHNFSAFADDGE